jgi:hypothetical protein
MAREGRKPKAERRWVYNYLHRVSMDMRSVGNGLYRRIRNPSRPKR